MGVAYFIVLDNPEPGFDTYVNGKAIAHNADRLVEIAERLGIKAPEDYLSMNPDEFAAFAEDFGPGPDESVAELPPEQWFDTEEGLEWVRQLREHLEADASAFNGRDAVLYELAEYESVLSQAKAVNAKWHLQVDV